ncbi:MAG: septum formation protein Maf [Lentisphaeria bacterium]|nr:septum formation protein Maf [Lentisphaeria bacterium]
MTPSRRLGNARPVHLPCACTSRAGPLVLASASPRRQTLLREAGIPFEVRPAAVDESVLPGESPAAHVRRLAARKAEAVSALLPASLVLGADTVVALDGVIHGKPEDRAGAEAMLRGLSGRWHEVLTGVVLIRCRPAWRREWVCRTRVRFRPLDRATIGRYCDLVNPLDKAGAYGIQEHGDILVEAIEGPRSNVIGLPIEEVLAVLDEAPPG